MADTALSALATFTPILTDRVYGVDDPTGTPVSGGVTFAAMRSLIEANLQAPVIATTLRFDGVTLTGLTGSDVTLVTGTAGTSGDLAVWNGDGDIVDGPTPPTGAIVGTSDTQTLTNKTLTSPTIGTSFVFDGTTVTGLAGADVTVLTGTAGTDGNLCEWNADGDIVDSGATISSFATINGATFTGAVNWSGTSYFGLRLQSMTTAQRDGNTPGNGDMIYNATTGQVEVYYNSTWYVVGSEELADPDADALAGWDDSAGTGVYFTLGDGITTSGTVVSVAVAELAYNVNAQTGTTYTLALTDQNGIVTMSNASANTLTIPANATVAFPVGTIVEVVMLGAGTTTVAGDTGVTVNGASAGSGDLSAQYGAVRLLKIATNTWVASGAIGAVS